MTNHQDSQAGDELPKIRSKFEKMMGDAWEKYESSDQYELDEYGEDYEKAYTYLFDALDNYAERLATRRAVEELKHLESLPSHVIRGSLINRIATLTKEIQQ